MNDSKQIKDAAAQWIARRDGENWTEADAAELARWLDASTENRIAFLRLEALWKGANRLKALGAGFKPGVVPSSADWREAHFFQRRKPDAHVRLPHPKRRRVAILSGLAASILLVLGLFGWHLERLEGDAYSTSLGVITAVPLPDGSKITLNTNSKIRVAITATRRYVNLERGEAFFEIARDPARPFVVGAGASRIVVLGTKFSVRHAGNGNELLVVVTEGKVGVVATGEDARTPRAELAAGNVARADDDGVVVQEHTLTEAEELLSWRSGHIVFHETTLTDAAAEFNRYSARKVVIADPEVATIRISGNFRTTSVDSFARLLENGFPVDVRREEDRIVLTHR